MKFGKGDDPAVVAQSLVGADRLRSVAARGRSQSPPDFITVARKPLQRRLFGTPDQLALSVLD